MISHLSLSGYQDSNLGPSGPKPDALTGLRYIPLLYCECKGKAFFLICKLFSKKKLKKISLQAFAGFNSLAK